MKSHNLNKHKSVKILLCDFNISCQTNDEDYENSGELMPYCEHRVWHLR